MKKVLWRCIRMSFDIGTLRGHFCFFLKLFQKTFFPKNYHSWVSRESARRTWLMSTYIDHPHLSKKKIWQKKLSKKQKNKSWHLSSVLLHKSSPYMYYNCRFWYNRVWSTYLVFLSSQKYDFPIEKVQNLDFEGQYLGNGAKWTSKKLLLIMCNSSNWALLETQKKFH